MVSTNQVELLYIYCFKTNRIRYDMTNQIDTFIKNKKEFKISNIIITKGNFINIKKVIIDYYEL